MVGAYRKFEWVAVVTAFAVFAMPSCDAEPSLLTQNVETVERQLAPLLNCDWVGPNDVRVCPWRDVYGQVALTKCHNGRSICGFEITAFVPDDVRKSGGAQREEILVAKLVAQLFPNWRNARPWVSRSLRRARKPAVRSTTHAEGCEVVAYSIIPADIDGLSYVVKATKSEIDGKDR